MSDYVLRLGLVLPLLLLGLVGVLVAAKRGLIRLPGVAAGAAPLRLVQVVALGPVAKLAVAEFGGERLLIGVGREGVRLLERSSLAPLAPTPSPSLEREGDPCAAPSPLARRGVVGAEPKQQADIQFEGCRTAARIPLPFKGGARGGCEPQAGPLT